MRKKYNGRIVRVGVIGAGAIAQRRHLPEYATNPNAKIVSIYDPNSDRLEDICEEYNAYPAKTEYDLLARDDIDAVSVCVPNFMHARLTIAALKAGKHVLCEKPMALTLDETREMLAAEKESGKTLMLGHNQRLIAAHLKARELIHNGVLGKLIFFQCNFKHSGPENWSIDSNNSTWFFDKARASFGVMGDLGAHKIDLIRFLTDAEISEVLANLMTLDKRYDDGRLIDVEDNAVCEFRMDNGLPGIMHFSWTNYGQEDNSTIIYGEKGVMKIFGDYADDIVIEMRDNSMIKYAIGGISTNTNQIKSGVIDEFIAAILEERRPIVTGIDGHNTLAVIEKAFESARERRWLEVEY